jgi:hypothetical protein
MINPELIEIESNPERLGEYIYMGMGLINGHRCCLSVAYKMNYAIKKANQFVEASNNAITFDKINKVKVGQLKAEREFQMN